MTSNADALKTAIDAVVGGADSDTEYDALYPHHVRPGSFAHRVATDKKLDNEQHDTFEECYPDYVTRFAFREMVAAAQNPIDVTINVIGDLPEESDTTSTD